MRMTRKEAMVDRALLGERCNKQEEEITTLRARVEALETALRSVAEWGPITPDPGAFGRIEHYRYLARSTLLATRPNCTDIDAVLVTLRARVEKLEMVRVITKLFMDMEPDDPGVNELAHAVYEAIAACEHDVIPCPRCQRGEPCPDDPGQKEETKPMSDDCTNPERDEAVERALDKYLPDGFAIGDDATSELALLCADKDAENARLLKWVRDLQDGGQVNCVYCGWNAGPRESTAPALAEQLYHHVRECEKHPMAETRRALVRILVFSLNHQIISPPDVAAKHVALLDEVATVLNSARCLICGQPVPDYEPEMCCNGQDCICHGQPINPCTCSDRCFKALMDGIGKEYEQRRIDAGIELWGTAADVTTP